MSKAADQGTIPDEENPLFLFSGTATELLIRLVRGEIDALQLAKKTLSDRGLDRDGKWVGFDEAQKRKTNRPRGKRNRL